MRRSVHRGGRARRGGAPRLAAGVVAALLLAAPVGGRAETGAVEVSIRLPAGVSAPVALRVGDLEATVTGPTHRFGEVAPGQHAVTAEVAAGGTRYLGVVPVTVAAGAPAAAAVVELSAVKDVDAFCRTCHPDPGGAAAAGAIARDLHPSGVPAGGRTVTCESCHSPHRPTGNPKYALAPFQTASDLCAGCHDRGHAARGASVEPCLNCHALAGVEIERGTSLISAASRTLPVMKTLGGGKAPEVFGCTYCHGNPLNRERMRDVLLGFGAGVSRHPVGRSLSTGADSMGEYRSSTATSLADELECTDCHAPALLVDPAPENQASKAPYANHVPPAAAARAGNRAMLRAATADALCLTCHGHDEAFAKADAAVRAHGDRDLREKDGTPLKTSSCTACHNSHFSSNRKLFRDGTEGGAPVLVGDPRQCSTVCHERGDSTGSFDLRGHGKDSSASGRAMRFGCGSCHSVDAAHEGRGPGLLNFEVDGRTSRYGTSLESVCYVCHRGYAPHPVAGGVGCLDCHDEHAEGTAGPDGQGANIFMIPRRLPARGATGGAVVFEKAAPGGAYDYYRADGAGLCDNAWCHGGITSPSGTPIEPLSGLMQGGKHGGGDLAPGSNCGVCHRHDSPSGSWTTK